MAIGATDSVRRPKSARADRLWTVEDFASGRGLEIGPLHNRVVWQDEADVHYLDVFDRETLRKNYEGHPIDLDAIPEVEYVLIPADGRVRTIPEAVGGDPAFDWVVASHVVEHVPDVIGWLRQVAEITNDGGRLILVVPDRRFCFDLHRPITTVGQMVHEHELGSTRPSTRAIYDYLRSAVTIESREAWAGAQPGFSDRIHDMQFVQAEVERGRSGVYVDSHVWVFTPGCFVEQMTELRDLGLSDWKVVELSPTPRGDLEFIAVLERLPRDGWGPDDVVDALDPGLAAPEWITLEWRLAEKNDELEGRLRRAMRQNRRLKAELEAVRASRQWRAGNLVLGPARFVRKSLRR